MKKQFPLILLLATVLALAGCKKEKPTAQAFSSQVAAQEQQEVQHEDATVDVLKQRVARGTSEIVLKKKAFTVSYNKRTLTPNWVAWTLTRDHTRGKLLRDEENFEEDTAVPEPRATWQDYYNSRYDRGHMCPAGDNKWDQQAMTESFLMTNICPQNHGLNKEDWNDLEMKCRDWARAYGSITIVCGPLFEYEGEPKRIGKNKVWVPTGFFKAVYVPAGNGYPSKAVGFIFDNNGKNQPWRQMACSIDEIEQRTGIDFFHQLPDAEEDRVEALESTKTWK